MYVYEIKPNFGLPTHTFFFLFWLDGTQKNCLDDTHTYLY